MDDLRTVFVAAVGPDRRAEAEALPELHERLATLAETAAADTPFDVEPESFVLYLAERLPAGTPLDDALTRLRPGDLHLASRCAQNDAAVAEVERRHGPHIARALDGIRDRQLLPDDLHQIVRQRLFVGSEEAPPLIARYAGQGKLASWLRVTAKRLALNAVRDHNVRALQEDDDALLDVPDAAGDAELDLLRERYGQAFREAFAHALSELPERARTLIRLSIVEGVSVRKLGKMYGTHPATAARWVARARHDLVDLTLTELGKRVDMSADKLDSVLKLVRSRLDLSVVRLLGG